MFLSRVTIPPVSAYEVHQHLHPYFDAPTRRFIYRRMSDTDVLMLSVVRPRTRHAMLDIATIPCGRPLSFAADLVIQKHVARVDRRVDLRGRFERRAWLKRKLEGAATLRFVRFEDAWLQVKPRTRVVLVQATGVLEITDRAKFVQLLQQGIGRNKFCGCGLIWLPEIMPWSPD